MDQNLNILRSISIPFKIDSSRNVNVGERCHWYQLSYSITAEILRFLCVSDLCRLLTVSKDLCSIISLTPHLWWRVDATGLSYTDNLLRNNNLLISCVRQLDLSCSTLSIGSFMGILLDFSDLSLLQLDFCKIMHHEKCWRILETFTVEKLNFLSMRNMDISSTDLEMMQMFRFPNLSHLNLSGISTITSSLLRHICFGSCDLQTLIVNECSTLQSFVFAQISEGCPKLHRLEANCCGFPTHQETQHQFGLNCSSLIQLSRNCHQLEHLGISLNMHVQNDGIISASPYLTQLHTLDLSFMIQLSSEAILEIFKNCCLMKSLNLCRVESMDDECVGQMVNNCSRLENINIRMCTRVSVFAVHLIAEELTHLRCLQCFAITKSDHHKLKLNEVVINSEFITSEQTTNEELLQLMNR